MIFREILIDLGELASLRVAEIPDCLAVELEWKLET